MSIILLLVSDVAAPAGGTFAEGYSSAEPYAPAAIAYRAFTIYSMDEACEASPVPFEIRLSPDPIMLHVGDTLMRTDQTALSVQAYDDHGNFLPGIPIIVSLSDPNDITTTWADWDYFEATAEGNAELIVSWACTDEDYWIIRAAVPVIVQSR